MPTSRNRNATRRTCRLSDSGPCTGLRSLMCCRATPAHCPRISGLLSTRWEFTYSRGETKNHLSLTTIKILSTIGKEESLLQSRAMTLFHCSPSLKNLMIVTESLTRGTKFVFNTSQVSVLSLPSILTYTCVCILVSKSFFFKTHPLYDY